MFFTLLMTYRHVFQNLLRTEIAMFIGLPASFESLLTSSPDTLLLLL